MRAAPLTTIKGGINRLRTKGGARADVLYDLLNGYVTEAGSVVVRPGTGRTATLDPLTRGLCAFDGKLYTFCHTYVDLPTGYYLAIIAHPDPPDVVGVPSTPLKTIHFAEPFLGGLYIVAEFQDDATYHFWLQTGNTWEANKEYKANDLVEPSVPNGLLYQAARASNPNPPWQPDEPRADATPGPQSVVEPTTYTGYYYQCIETQGPNPRSGTTEPVWPTVKGDTVIERVDTGLPETAVIDSVAPPPAGSGSLSPSVPDPVADRYGTGLQGALIGVTPRGNYNLP